MSDDLISRRAAIDAVVKYATWLWERFHETCNVVGVSDALREVPTAQPEYRQKGKWIIVTDRQGRHAECPYCGEWKYHSKQKFCGECGAEMEVEER